MTESWILIDHGRVYEGPEPVIRARTLLDGVRAFLSRRTAADA